VSGLTSFHALHDVRYLLYGRLPRVVHPTYALAVHRVVNSFRPACVRGFVGGIGAKFRPYIRLIGLAERPSSLPVLVWFVRTLDALKSC
jgi:ABC-type phosphate/phosphonate transport system permease subunit